jgi:hypothetical protein
MSLQKKKSSNVLKSLFRDTMDSKDTNFSVFNLLAVPFLAIHPHFHCIPFRIITANSYWLSQITTLTTDSTEQCAIRNKQSEFNLKIQVLGIYYLIITIDIMGKV